MTDILDDDLQQAINNSLAELGINSNNNIEELSFEEQINLATNLSFQESYGSEYNSCHKIKIKKNNNEPVPFNIIKESLPKIVDIANNVFPYFKVLYKCCNNYYYNDIDHDNNEDHEADTNVSDMICLYCNVKQNIQKDCSNCKKRLANFLCLKCNIFTFSTFHKHCDICNFCSFNTFHCKKCNVCHKKNGNCSDEKKKFNTICCICQNNVSLPTLIGPRKTQYTIIKLKCCGNYIHKNCILDLFSHTQDNTCPYCRKTTHID